jgi:hypothetical protein
VVRSHGVAMLGGEWTISRSRVLGAKPTWEPVATPCLIWH